MFTPPPDKVMDCLVEFKSFLHYRSLPPLIHISLCHYQFETIHLFLDGNGRIGRLLIMLLLVEQQMLPPPLLYLSAFFETTRDEYYKRLYNVSSKGVWCEWVKCFLNGIAIQSKDVLSRAERINELFHQCKIAVARGSSQVPVAMVQRLVKVINSTPQKLK